MREAYIQPSAAHIERLTHRFQAYAAFEDRVKSFVFSPSFDNAGNNVPTDTVIDALVGESVAMQDTVQRQVTRFFTNEQTISSWVKETWFEEKASSATKKDFFEQLGIWSPEQAAVMVSQSSLSRIPGGIACTVTPEVMEQIVVGKIHTPEREIIDPFEIRQVLASHATVGFLLEKDALANSQLTQKVKDALHVVFILDAPGKKRAIQHEINEILSSYIMDAAEQTGMYYDGQVALGLHDLAARIETGESIEGIGLGTLGFPKDYVEDPSHKQSLEIVWAVLSAAQEQIEEKGTEAQQIAAMIRAGMFEPRNILAVWGKTAEGNKDTEAKSFFWGNNETPILEAKIPGRFVFSRPTLEVALPGKDIVIGVNAIHHNGATYKISSQINRGGMGVVYAGELLSGTGPQHVAIKEMLDDIPEAFIAEGNAGSSFVDAWIAKQGTAPSPKLLLSEIKGLCRNPEVRGTLEAQIRLAMKRTNIFVPVAGRNVRLDEYMFASPGLVDEYSLNQKHGNTTIRSVLFATIAQGLNDFAGERIGELFRSHLSEIKDAFFREHAMMHMFQHIPIVPRVYGDVLQTEAPDTPRSRVRNYYVVMELFTEQSLDALQGIVSPKEMVEYMIELLGFLPQIHKAGAVHHDIKPSNIIIKDGHVKLLDYGAAFAKSDSQAYRELLRRGVPTKYGFIATPYYCPPDATNQASSTTDLYAIGKMLEEFIPLNIRTRVLSQVVRKAIQPLRKDRYLTAEAMQADLLHALKNLKNPQPVQFAQVPRPQVRRDPAGLGDVVQEFVQQRQPARQDVAEIPVRQEDYKVRKRVRKEEAKRQRKDREALERVWKENDQRKQREHEALERIWKKEDKRQRHIQKQLRRMSGR